MMMMVVMMMMMMTKDEDDESHGDAGDVDHNGHNPTSQWTPSDETAAGGALIVFGVIFLTLVGAGPSEKGL